MKILKRVTRILVLILFILLASFGVALSVPKEQYQNRETQIELVERKEDETIEEEDHQQE